MKGEDGWICLKGHGRGFCRKEDKVSQGPDKNNSRGEKKGNTSLDNDFAPGCMFFETDVQWSKLFVYDPAADLLRIMVMRSTYFPISSFPY